MKKTIVLLAALLLLSGCATRSISETGYAQSDNPRRGYYGEQMSDELDELELLGIESKQAISEEDIAQALNDAKKISIPRNDSVLIVQSGAEFPDSEMVAALSSYWNVSQLSGRKRDYADRNLNKTLRYAAATSGSRYVMAYWGIVETAEKNLATRNVSWVPVLGWSLPDKTVGMRIRLKFAVIDVVSGKWQIVQPPAADAEFVSSIMNREGKDQEKVIELKAAVYKQAAESLFAKFGGSRL